jgi:hypothetical protein
VFTLLSFKSGLAPIPAKGAETPVTVAYTVCRSLMFFIPSIASNKCLIGLIPALFLEIVSSFVSKINNAFF